MTDAIAETFLRHFSDNCTDGRVKPPPMDELIVGGVALLTDPSTDQPVPVTVAMGTAPGAFHETRLPATGMYMPDKNVVVISPTVGACRTPASWKNVLTSVLRHELTHSIDPGFYRQNSRLNAWEKEFQAWAARAIKHDAAMAHDPETRLMYRIFGTRHASRVGRPPDVKHLPKYLRKWGKAAIAAVEDHRNMNLIPPAPRYFNDLCDYLKNPFEARAFLAQVGTELRLAQGRIPADHPGFKSPDQALRALSPTFDVLDTTEKDGKKCLLPKDRRRILKMAARTWDEGFLPRRKKSL